MEAAERRATEAFAPVLDTLVGELAVLRVPVPEASGTRPAAHASDDPHASVQGPVAVRMVDAARRWAPAGRFVTPMAAVAGAVADHVLASILDARAGAHGLRRVGVNDGGDIALWLAPGETWRVGVCDDPRTGALAAGIDVRDGDRVGGIATSGRRGRSLSFGIADAVTVLARDAAAADVAATLIAGAVDLPGSDRVERLPADELDADTDLGGRPVTVDVAPLSSAQRIAALEGALPLAREGIEGGWLVAAFLSLQGEIRSVGDARRLDASR